MKKIFAMLLVLAMAFTMVSAVAENNDEHMLIYGTSTEIGGDFAPGAWWTNNATDKTAALSSATRAASIS